MHSTKSSGATRRVWRMTADNQLGEILELTEESHSACNRQVGRSGRTRSERVKPPALLGDSTGFASRGSWRASSYDLLQGLSVRDVSEKIPQRAFEELFSPDPSAAVKP